MKTIKQLGIFNLVFVTLFVAMMWIDQDVIRTNIFITISFPFMVLANYLNVIIRENVNTEN